MPPHTLAAEIRALSAVDRRRGLLALSVEVAVIAGASLLASQQPAFVPLAVLIIATRQRSLADLLHAGAHRHLARSVRLNDLLSALIAWSLGYSAWAYRRGHCRDHDRDTPPPLAVPVLLGQDGALLPLSRRMGMPLLYAAVLIIAVDLGLLGELIGLWLLPRLVMPALPANVGWLDPFSLRACAAQHRTAHMRFPGVPWYRLARLDEVLASPKGRGSGSVPRPTASTPCAPRPRFAHQRR